MTVRADRALRSCDVIVGYHVYVDLVRDRYPDKEFLTTGMTRETDRCRMALEAAREGKTVAMVCSGDSGIYGMAGLIYELRGEAAEPEVEVIPGLTAACSGGALLGAPLTHDFAVISLSDRLTPLGDDREAAVRRRVGGPVHRPLQPPPATAVRTTSAGPATSCWRPCRPSGCAAWPGTSAGRVRAPRSCPWGSSGTSRQTCSARCSSATARPGPSGSCW